MRAPAIENATRFAVEPHVVLEADGEKLVTIVKGTFEQDAAGMLIPSRMPRPIRFADELWGDPATTPARYPSDAVGEKPGTDIVVVAEAHAPNGKAVPSLDCGVKVGAVEKTIRVFGLRVWQEGGGLSAPRPFTQQSIRYDHAWGGIDPTDPSYGEPRNPVGSGMVRDRSLLAHQPAPCVEDPLRPIGGVGAESAPAGLGPIGTHWMPRRGYAGTYDEAWLRDQAPLSPLDFDPRANQCATPDLIASPHLQGREEVALLNLHSGGGTLAFSLPSDAPTVVHVHEGRRPEERRPALDTVIIDTIDVSLPSRVTVELVWRTVMPLPRFVGRHRIVIR
ncbi:MAG: DUF2169 domain-containing protein [Polyangiaceae bacterium]